MSQAAALACVKSAYMAEEQQPKGVRLVYNYETCATDTASVQRVFEAVSGLFCCWLFSLVNAFFPDIFLMKNLETFI